MRALNIQNVYSVYVCIWKVQQETKRTIYLHKTNTQPFRGSFLIFCDFFISSCGFLACLSDERWLIWKTYFKFLIYLYPTHSHKTTPTQGRRWRASITTKRVFSNCVGCVTKFEKFSTSAHNQYMTPVCLFRYNE